MWQAIYNKAECRYGELRRNVIDNFDGEESSNTYAVGAVITIDVLSGFNFTADTTYIKPFSEYTGTEYISNQ